jgi:hypothetical protein
MTILFFLVNTITAEQEMEPQGRHFGGAGAETRSGIGSAVSVSVGSGSDVSKLYSYYQTTAIRFF